MIDKQHDISGTARPKAIVIYSGGMDSYTVLHHALRQDYDVHAVSFHYGQRHSRELNVAQSVCHRLGIAHQVVDIRAIHSLIDNSALTDASRDLPGGDYDGDNMVATLVPNRNMILLSLAIAQAVNIGAEVCFYGAHGGDHVLYPDCRPEFVERMNAVAAIANVEAVRIEAPYLHVDKAAILADGLAMGLDYSETWTCYLGEELACGGCGSCRERLAAFAANGIDDPIRYCLQRRSLQRPDTAADLQRPNTAADLQRPNTAADLQRPNTAADLQQPNTAANIRRPDHTATHRRQSEINGDGESDV